MALVWNGTAVNLEPNLIPTGSTIPTVTKFNDQEYTQIGRVVVVAKLGVEDPTQSVTFDALLVQLDTDIQAIVSADYDVVGATITGFAAWTGVGTNLSVSQDLYTNVAVSYNNIVDVFIKTS